MNRNVLRVLALPLGFVLFIAGALLGWAVLMLTLGNLLWQDWEVAPDRFKVVCLAVAFFVSGASAFLLVRKLRR